MQAQAGHMLFLISIYFARFQEIIQKQYEYNNGLTPLNLVHNNPNTQAANSPDTQRTMRP